jgi:hypothetical protein
MLACREDKGGGESSHPFAAFCFPNGAQANQLLMHGMIRVGVATSHQFPIYLSDSMASSFPPFAEKGQLCIKSQLSWARVLFGKRVTAQPARNRGMAYPHLAGNSRLREALFA